MELENRLASERGSEERKNRQLQHLGHKESQFLRLRRTRLTMNAFRTLKVIGKGAFGEVRDIQRFIESVTTNLLKKKKKGTTCTEAGYWENICHENASQI